MKGSIFIVFTITRRLGKLDCNKHEIFIRSDHNLFVSGFYAEKGQITQGVEIPDHALSLLREKGDILGIVIT